MVIDLIESNLVLNFVLKNTVNSLLLVLKIPSTLLKGPIHTILCYGQKEIKKGHQFRI